MASELARDGVVGYCECSAKTGDDLKDVLNEAIRTGLAFERGKANKVIASFCRAVQSISATYFDNNSSHQTFCSITFQMKKD